MIESSNFFQKLLTQIEHFEDNKNKDVTYDEDKGMFTIKKKLFLGLLNLGNANVYEKDSTITKINELRESSESTTLTKYDIDKLYDYAKLGFNYTGDRAAFEHVVLKDIFIGLNDNKLMIHKLMPQAYDYMDAIGRGEKPPINKTSEEDGVKEGFTAVYELNHTNIMAFASIVFVLLLLYLVYLYIVSK